MMTHTFFPALAGDLKKGYQVKTVDNAEEAIDLLSQASFDLVITDLIMAGAGGLEVLKKAKALNPEIKVIILTGFGEINSERDVFRFDADDYLLKSSEPEKIYRRVATCLEKLDHKRNIKKQSEALARVNQKLQEEIEIRKQKEDELLQSQINLKARLNNKY